MATIQYTSRLVSTAADGVLVEAKYMKDESKGKLQSEINEDIYQKLSSLSPGGGGSSLPKGEVQTYQDLPENPEIGDTYIVRQSTRVGDKRYSPGSHFYWSQDETWECIGGEIDTEYIEGRLQAYEVSGAGKLLEVKTDLEQKIEDARAYTDSRINETLSWIEDEDLFPGSN